MGRHRKKTRCQDVYVMPYMPHVPTSLNGLLKPGIFTNCILLMSNTVMTLL